MPRIVMNQTIRAELAAQGKSMNDLSAFLDLSRSNVNLRLRGETDWKYTELINVARFLDMDIYALAALAAEREARDKKAGE